MQGELQGDTSYADDELGVVADNLVRRIGAINERRLTFP